MFTSVINNIVIAGVISSAAYFYYDYSQSKIDQLKQENAQLKIVTESCEETTDALQRDLKRSQQLANQLESRARQAEEYQDQLIEKLNKHDLTALTLKKPGLIETRVNDATKKVFEEIESTTSGN